MIITFAVRRNSLEILGRLLRQCHSPLKLYELKQVKIWSHQQHGYANTDTNTTKLNKALLWMIELINTLLYNADQ